MTHPTKQQIGDPVEPGEVDAAWENVMGNNSSNQQNYCQCGHQNADAEHVCYITWKRQKDYIERLRAALDKERQRYMSLADRQAKKGKDDSAQEFWEKAESIEKVLKSGDSSAPIKCPMHGFVRHADCPGCPDDSPVETTKNPPHWTCRTHGDFDAMRAVGCPECMRLAREALRNVRDHGCNECV